ncbi:unnamed protein product [Owenia fusiformis]|nr:unnamed protein product [Owenia fusiformis]
MGTYEASVRPGAYWNETLAVTFTLMLNRIVELDERQQLLTTSAFLEQIWVDKKLSWEVDDYGGVESLRISGDAIWCPDTFIFNNAEDTKDNKDSLAFIKDSYLIVNHKGIVMWTVPVKLKTLCKVDITYFPFDDQECSLHIGSWAYNQNGVLFLPSNNATDLSTYVDNSEWVMRYITMTINSNSSEALNSPVAEVTYKLYIRRKTVYYVFNILVPCIMLSILTMLMFWIPVTSGEKIALGLSIYLAFSMFMLLIAEQVPASSESVPLLGLYLVNVMSMTAASVVMAVLVSNIHGRGNIILAKPVPKLLKVLFIQWLATALRIPRDAQLLARFVQLESDVLSKYTCRGRANKKPLKHDTNMHYLESTKTDNVPKRHQDAKCSNKAITRHLDHNVKENTTTLERTTIGHKSIVTCHCIPHEDVWVKRKSFENIHKGKYEPDPDNQQRQSQESYSYIKAWLARNSIEESEPKYNAERTIREKFNINKLKINALRVLKNVSNGKLRNQKKDTRSKCGPIRLCKRMMKLEEKKLLISEWHIVASVVDRLFFWLYIIVTISGYLIMFVVLPGSKEPVEIPPASNNTFRYVVQRF